MHTVVTQRKEKADSDVLTGPHISSTWLNVVAALNKCDVNEFAEVLAAPAKYALFQVLGNELVRTLCSINKSTHSLSERVVSSASIGALGGAVLTMIYTALLIRLGNRIQVEDGSSLQSISCSLFQNLGKEIIYSALAAIMGTFIIGRERIKDLGQLILAGSLGPIVASSLMFAMVGLIVLPVWAISKTLRGARRTTTSETPTPFSVPG